MANYDFSILNPYEFQELANDIISLLLCKRVERFKQGRDWGIDGRVTLDNNEIGIVQAKHYISSSVKALIRDLEKHERPKVHKLSPDRYFIVTSLGLSPKDKNDIVRIFTPFIISTEDVFGRDDLNTILAKNDQIEKSFPKLWLQTSSILQNIFHSKIVTLSDQLLAKASENQKFYVSTEQHKKARAILNDEHVVLITGEPGVGKTSIAEQLCLESVAEGYDLYVINDNIDEAFTVLDFSRRQMFYFDDFLGSNFLEVLRFNEDSKIMKFIAIILKNEWQRFILTSRTNILDQAYSIGESFNRNKLKTREFLITISDYSDFDKAMILYSFIWRSNITQQQLKLFVSKKIYKYIVDHKSYNPRLLEFITSDELLRDKTPEEYLLYVHESLSNPQSVWEGPYERQLNTYSRTVVDLIVLAGGSLSESRLEGAYTNFLKMFGKQDIFLVESDLWRQLKVLSRSFIKRESFKGEHTYYAVFNPSISDYVLKRYIKRAHAWANMLSLYVDFKGIEFLASIPCEDYKSISSVAKNFCEILGEALYEKDFYSLAMIFKILDFADSEILFSAYPIENIIKYLRETLQENDAVFAAWDEKKYPPEDPYGLLAALNDTCSHDGEIIYLSSIEVDFIEAIINLNGALDKEIVDIVKMILRFPNHDLEYLDSVSSILSEIELSDEEYNEVYAMFYEKIYNMWDLEEFDNFIDKNKEKIKSQIIKVKNDTDNTLLDYRFKKVRHHRHDIDYIINFDYISDMMVDEYEYLFACITKNDALNFIDEHSISLLDSCFDISEKRNRKKEKANKQDFNIDSLFKELIKNKNSKRALSA